MTPQQFIDRWKPVTLSERAAAQSHFNDLCRLLDHPTPVEVDPRGEHFAFEKGLQKSGGGLGFADVWKRGHFAWEYKKKRANLEDALGQLARYALALESPPLHIACDTSEFRIVTAWTNTTPYPYTIRLDELRDSAKLDILRSAFHEPSKLRKGRSRADLTRKAADRFSSIALRLRDRGHAPEAVAHLVNRLAFLFFAEDVRLLPKDYFRRALEEVASRPHETQGLFDELFAVLRKGGRFGLERLPHINGGLFDDQPALPLDEGDVQLLVEAGRQDWAHIDPSIFGTLFERFLDPDKRAQIGAHYTDADKIKRIVEPLLMHPLRAEWETARAEIERLTDRARKKGDKAKEWQRAEERRSAFLERLRTLEILDPACGSGNFLYTALHAVKDLEHAANQECEIYGLPPRMPMVGPEILRGLEVNPLAAELARTTVWIGDIQWAVRNGFNTRPEPILRRLDTIECRDALIEADGSKSEWPNAEFIIGNPPFLGTKKMVGKLGRDYTDSIRSAYSPQLSPFSDLVCWWFEKARQSILRGTTARAGFVATNSIRGGKNRSVLDKISEDLHIFEARSDEPWINDGAAVRVSIVCFQKAKPDVVHLDGRQVDFINPDLTSGSDLNGGSFTKARPLLSNEGVAFNGIVKGGKFEVDGKLARQWVNYPANAIKGKNLDVVRPWKSGDDITSRDRDLWLIDFGSLTIEQASHYDAPFSWVAEKVKPYRLSLPEKREKHYWWQLSRPGSAMKASLIGKSKYIAIPEVSKHQIPVMLDNGSIPDKNLIVIGVDDFVTFGILSSRFHRAWASRLGTSLEDRPRYTSSTTFRTYPFPESLQPRNELQIHGPNTAGSEIDEIAGRLHLMRDAWLNPGDLFDLVDDVDPVLPKRFVLKYGRSAKESDKFTITNLYNKRPVWLDALHEELDAAVARAYGWPEDITIDDAMTRLIVLNAELSGTV